MVAEHVRTKVVAGDLAIDGAFDGNAQLGGHFLIPMKPLCDVALLLADLCCERPLAAGQIDCALEGFNAHGEGI